MIKENKIEFYCNDHFIAISKYLEALYYNNQLKS